MKVKAGSYRQQREMTINLMKIQRSCLDGKKPFNNKRDKKVEMQQSKEYFGGIANNEKADGNDLPHPSSIHD